jgi:hypothetical protein
MSNKALTWAFETDLPMTQKFVLVALADKADESHSCFPGQKMIAEMVGAGERTIRRALDQLEEAGYIERQRRTVEGGWRTSDRYVLAVGTMFDSQADNLAGRANRPSATGQPANDDTPTGQSGRAREPKENPKKNPQKTQRRATRLEASGFEVTPELAAWAKATAPAVNGPVETEKFFNYWNSIGGARGLKVDWALTFKNWFLTAQQHAVDKGWTPAKAAADPNAWMQPGFHTPKRENPER